jgi:hypothetical protein
MARELTALAAAEALERPALALQILMRATGASEGHLYRYQGDELALLTRSVEQAAPSALGQFLLNYLRSHEVVTDETVDMTYATRLIRPDGFIEPALLVANRAGGERTIVAVAALSFSGAYRWPDPNLLALIAEQLAP